MSLPEQPVSKQELLRSVWNSNFERNANLVEVTVRRLREAIEVDPSKPTYVVTVQRRGYKFTTKAVDKHTDYLIDERAAQPRHNYSLFQDESCWL
jgi:DNA-binding winged helix-turn-helix (wHTH) protein